MLHTLEQARGWLLARRNKGAQCPCCDQFVKVYKRKISSAMARALIEVYKNETYKNDTNYREFIHAENFFKNIPGLPSSIRGDFVKLKHWELIEAKDGSREDGNPNNGYYRITARGRAFVMGWVGVEKYAFLYNGECIDWSDEHANIGDCLGNKFNYSELMSA